MNALVCLGPNELSQPDVGRVTLEKQRPTKQSVKHKGWQGFTPGSYGTPSEMAVSAPGAPGRKLLGTLGTHHREPTFLMRPNINIMFFQNTVTVEHSSPHIQVLGLSCL